MKQPSFSIALMILLAGPVVAQEQTLRVKDCGVFCKVWRNVSGKAQVSFADPIPHEADVSEAGPPIAAEDGATAPQVNKLVVVHGDIIAKSAADRKAEARRRAKFEQGIDVLRPSDTGDEHLSSASGAVPKKATASK